MDFPPVNPVPSPGPFLPDIPLDVVALIARKAQITRAHAALVAHLAGLGERAVHR